MARQHRGRLSAQIMLTSRPTVTFQCSSTATTSRAGVARRNYIWQTANGGAEPVRNWSNLRRSSALIRATEIE